MTVVEGQDVGTTQRPGAPLLEVQDVRVWFPIQKGVMRRTVGHVKAVDGVSFTLERGRTLGIVGESGCGKSTLLRAVMRLVRPTSGVVRIDGADVSGLSGARMQALRRRIQFVFQDPYASLDPRMSVASLIAEPLSVHRVGTKQERRGRVEELLGLVGLRPEHAGRYPHEFSGGQRQRIGIARALALSPDLVLLDEPVSALDVSIQAQVLNLLDKLQDELQLSYLFVAHDLSVVRHVSDEIMVMYLGKVMEIADAATIVSRPSHPYTNALLSAVPVPHPELERRRAKRRTLLQGDLPSPANPPSGCVFRTRCPRAETRCGEDVPALVDRGDGHPVACHFPDIVKAPPPTE